MSDLNIYKIAKEILIQRDNIVQALIGIRETNMLTENNQIKTLGNFYQKINTYESQIRARQDIFQVIRPKKETELGEIPADDEVQSCYSLQYAATSCENSPPLSEIDNEMIEASFNEIVSKLQDSTLLKVEDSVPTAIYAKEFNQLQKSSRNMQHIQDMKNGQREILIQDIDESSYELQSTQSIQKCLRDHFYDACNISSQIYDFYISKASLIYYKGLISLLLRFCDEKACKFMYYSLYHSKNKYNNSFGPNYKVYLVEQNQLKIKNPNYFSIVLRNLDYNITKIMIQDRVQKIIGYKPKHIEGPQTIKNAAHAIIVLDSVEDCEQICKQFQRLKEKNSKSQIIKSNIHPMASRIRSGKKYQELYKFSMQHKFFDEWGNYPQINLKSKKSVSDNSNDSSSSSNRSTSSVKQRNFNYKTDKYNRKDKYGRYDYKNEFKYNKKNDQNRNFNDKYRKNDNPKNFFNKYKDRNYKDQDLEYKNYKSRSRSSSEQRYKTSYNQNNKYNGKNDHYQDKKFVFYPSYKRNHSSDSEPRQYKNDNYKHKSSRFK